MELTVDRDGLALDPTVLESGGPAFDEQALRAVASLRFEPATKDGVPILARIPFHFEFVPQVATVADPVPAQPLEPAELAPTPETEDEPLVAEGLTLEVRGARPPVETTVHRVEAEEIRVIPGTNGDALRVV